MGVVRLLRIWDKEPCSVDSSKRKSVKKVRVCSASAEDGYVNEEDNSLPADEESSRLFRWMAKGAAYRGYCYLSDPQRSSAHELPYVSTCRKYFFKKFIQRRRPAVLHVLGGDHLEGQVPQLGVLHDLSLFTKVLDNWRNPEYLQRNDGGNPPVEIATSKEMKEMHFREFLRLLSGNRDKNSDEIVRLSANHMLSLSGGLMAGSAELAEILASPPHVMGKLVPAKCTLSVGNDSGPSNLHFDRYDRLYLGIKGVTKFRLFSPRCVESLGFPNDKIKTIFPTGLISFSDFEREDGASLEDVYGEKLMQALEETYLLKERMGKLKGFISLIQRVLGKPKPTKKELKAIQQYLKVTCVSQLTREFLELELSSQRESLNLIQQYYALGSEREQHYKKLEDEIVNKKIMNPVEHTVEDTFSIYRTTTRTLKEQKIFEANRNAEISMLKKYMEVAVKPGSLMYIPAGWIYETSAEVEDDHFYLGLNYWFFPPSSSANFDSPYPDSFWLRVRNRPLFDLSAYHPHPCEPSQSVLKSKKYGPGIAEGGALGNELPLQPSLDFAADKNGEFPIDSLLLRGRGANGDPAPQKREYNEPFSVAYSRILRLRRNKGPARLRNMSCGTHVGESVRLVHYGKRNV